MRKLEPLIPAGSLDVLKTADYLIDIGPEGGAGGGKDNPWSKENWNLTKQMELEINDPELAKSLKASAGK